MSTAALLPLPHFVAEVDLTQRHRSGSLSTKASLADVSPRPTLNLNHSLGSSDHTLNVSDTPAHSPLVICKVSPSEQLAMNAAAGPSHSRGSSEGRPDESQHSSDDRSPVASSLSSTPRAASPSFSQQHPDTYTINPTSERASSKQRALENLVPSSMTGLALQVQSAVSRNVTSPLLRVLSDAEHVNEQNGLPTCTNAESSSLVQSASHSSNSSNYASARGSPSLDAASLEPSNEPSRTGPGLVTMPGGMLDLTTTPMHSTNPHAMHVGSSGVDLSTTNQSDISRTPSTSTTGSSHASSLDTAISSVISSGDFESATQKVSMDENNPTTLRISIASHTDLTSGQVSPASVKSESEVLLVNLTGAADVPTVEVKLTVAKMRRYAALLELVDTERNYADDLATLVLIFFDNLCMMPFFNDHPARQALVIRNAKDLLRTHQKLSAKLEGILIDLDLRKSGSALIDDRAAELEKALSPQADEAVVRVAKLFHHIMPSLECYKVFCSRHGEALALIREAEKRQTEWDTYEKHCAEILKHTFSTPNRGSSRPVSGNTTPNYSTSHVASLTPVSASTSPTTAPAAFPSPTQAAPRHPSSRLLLRDFLIKPIQRLCLYPLVLQTLQKHSLATGAVADELSLAISLMREVADQVDEAGRRRESELRADLILSRVEVSQGITLPFVRSLGDCQLSGTLDVLHHHAVIEPLLAPLHFKYLGIFLYKGFVLMVKVRKNAVYECRHWFPLWAARLSNIEEESNLIPHSFRLSVQDHHFELAASNAKERQVWIDMLALAISQATVPLPEDRFSYPSSLSLDNVINLEICVEPATPNATHAAESQSYFESNKSSNMDPLMAFLAIHAAASTQATTQASQKGQRPQSMTWMPTEILLKHASPNSRSIVDRGMVLSEAVITARIAKDSGALSTLYAASGSGLGSAVGSSLGLNRLSTRETSTVKIQRRSSCVGLSENAEEEDDNNLTFTATLVQPGGRSRASSRGNADATLDRENWRASLMRKAGRVKSTNASATQLLTCNTSELGPDTWLAGSSSTPTSPTAVTRRGPFDFAANVSTVSTSGNEDLPFSLPSSPVLGLHSAGNSSVNLRAVGSMPPRTRSSLYGVKDTLSSSFAHRGRTSSAQDGFDTGANSAMSSLAPSPLSSNVNLAQGVTGESYWTSVEDVPVARQARSRTNSISSVTGSIRRALTNGPLKHRKSQSDTAKLYEISAQHARQMPMLGTGPVFAEPMPMHEAGEQCSPAGIAAVSPPQSPRSGTLRRSKTMLTYPKTWFRASTPTTSLEKINAEASEAQAHTLKGQRSFGHPAAAMADSKQGELRRPPRSRTVTDGATGTNSGHSDGSRRLSDTHLTTIQEQKPESAMTSPERRSSRMLNTLRFLQGNRFSPMPTNLGTESTSPVAQSPSSSPRRRLSGMWA